MASARSYGVTSAPPNFAAILAPAPDRRGFRQPSTDKQDAYDVLVEAAVRTGLERNAAAATTDSGLATGIANSNRKNNPFETAQDQFTAEVRPETV